MSKVFKRVKKNVKKRGRRLKKFTKKYGKKIATAAAIYFTGGAALGAMGSSWGALGSSMLTGAKALGTSMLTGGGGRPSFGGRMGGGMGNLGYGGEGSGGGWGNLLMGGLDAYSQYQGGKASQDAYNQTFQTANPFAQYRGQFGEQLSNFMQDPNSIAETPGYKFALEQGEKSIGRTAAATGGRLGGKRLYDVQKFGQGLASQMRQQEIQNLSSLSGATMGFGGGQYGAGAPGQYWGGIQQGMGSIGTSLGYGNNDRYAVRSV